MDTTSSSVPLQLRRRRAASLLCAPLECGRRDPWTGQHPDDWSLHELDSWDAAIAHLHGLRLPAVVPESVRRGAA